MEVKELEDKLTAFKQPQNAKPKWPWRLEEFENFVKEYRGKRLPPTAVLREREELGLLLRSGERQTREQLETDKHVNSWRVAFC